MGDERDEVRYPFSKLGHLSSRSLVSSSSRQPHFYDEGSSERALGTKTHKKSFINVASYLSPIHSDYSSEARVDRAFLE